MTEIELEKLKFPIGKHTLLDNYPAEKIKNCMQDIANLPERLQKEVNYLSNEQLDTAYRPDGWTVRQVLHHLADSHMNAFIRFKLTLTEDKPTIKPYNEAKWANLNDTKSMPIEPGLQLLSALHLRWTVVLQSLTEKDLQKKYVHPQYGKEYKLEDAVSLYAWHGNHHLAHITELKKRKGWS